ncbi:MAG: long-chain acyl-CoA synthetase [Bryobacterales bacterium]|nr:long-chain acyl-CoA synthetase [Bryobacterales bacterium]
MKSHLFLTGSTGTIGRRWLRLLLAADPSRHITVLVRDADRAIRDARVTVIIGDLRTPRLGVDRATWNWLTNTITEIVHCAADIRFNRSIEESRTVNTSGTRTVLGLAREASKLERFAHVSTTYVMGRDAGELPEREYDNCSGFVNPYEQAKYEAEREVFASMPNIPAAVFRLSSVAGSQTDYLHQALRLIPRNPLRLLPGVPGCRIDLISDEWAAAALSRLFDRHFRPGAVYNICAGAKASIEACSLINMAYASMGLHRRPVMVPLNEFERFAGHVLHNGERDSAKAILRSVSSFLPHLAIDQTFQNTATMALLLGDGLCPADSAEVVRNLLARLAGDLANVPVPACESIR